MRFLVLGIALLGLASTVQAGELPGKSPPVSLKLSVDEAQLIVETLQQIGCQTVGQMATCNLAVQTLKDIREQVIAQQRR